MTKYGMTFLLDVYDFEKETARQVLTTPGDYMRTQRWVSENLPGGDEDDVVRDMRVNYAHLHTAMKRRGELGENGLPEELTADVIDKMADRWSVYVNTVGEDQLPLSGQRGK